MKAQWEIKRIYSLNVDDDEWLEFDRTHYDRECEAVAGAVKYLREFADWERIQSDEFSHGIEVGTVPDRDGHTWEKYIYVHRRKQQTNAQREEESELAKHRKEVELLEIRIRNLSDYVEDREAQLINARHYANEYQMQYAKAKAKLDYLETKAGKK